MTHKVFEIATRGQGLYEFTDDVRDWAHGTGVMTLCIQHTSASLLIQENADPEVQSSCRPIFPAWFRHRMIQACII